MMIDKIKQDKKLLEKQLFWIENSFNECKKIAIKLENKLAWISAVENFDTEIVKTIKWYLVKYEK